MRCFPHPTQDSKVGFLPTISPASAQLPEAFGQLQQTAALLPQWLTTGKIRLAIANLSEANVDTSIGTGDTPFMQYLKKHRDESSPHLL